MGRYTGPKVRLFLDMAKKSKGNTASSLMQILESRLDNVLRRLGVGRTIWATRQIVAHGHVLVDGVKTDIASYLVNPSQLTAKVNAVSTPEDVPFEVNLNLIIEFYR